MTLSAQAGELLQASQLYITHYIFPVSKHILTAELTAALKSSLDLALLIFFFFVLPLLVFLNKNSSVPLMLVGGGCTFTGAQRKHAP